MKLTVLALLLSLFVQNLASAAEAPAPVQDLVPAGESRQTEDLGPKKLHPANRSMGGVHATMMSFFYEEPGLMKDTGTLYGVDGGFALPLNNKGLILIGTGYYVTGNTHYDGGTWGGDKLESNGHNTLFGIAPSIGFEIGKTGEHVFVPRAGLMLRTLNNKDEVAGSYTRDINQTFLTVGSDYGLLLGENSKLRFGAELQVLLAGTVRSKLSEVNSSYGDVENKQTQGSGVKLDMTYVVGWLSLQAYYQSFNIAKSNASPLIRNGKASAGYVFEPENNTRLTGVSAGMSF